MKPVQRYASFVVRLWYADNPETTSSEPLRGQITHVQSDHSGGIQTLEEIRPFIQTHLLDWHSRPVADEEENVGDDPGGK